MRALRGAFGFYGSPLGASTLASARIGTAIATATPSPPRPRTISFLTQDETKRLLGVMKNKRDRAIFLTAYRKYH